MKLILFGATGMVGASALRQALRDPAVEEVLCVGRSSTGANHPKLRELHLPDLFDFEGARGELSGYDACIWAVGVSSAGLDEAGYARLTEELTLVWAKLLLELNPRFSFCYCSAGGAGGKMMWARVRQRVEGALKAMRFEHVGVVRPGFIRPAPGIKSKTKAYQVGVVLLAPLFPLLEPRLPGLFTTSERLGRAMLRIVRGESDRYILESRDINRLGAAKFAR